MKPFALQEDGHDGPLRKTTHMQTTSNSKMQYPLLFKMLFKLRMLKCKRCKLKQRNPYPSRRRLPYLQRYSMLQTQHLHITLRWRVRLSPQIHRRPTKQPRSKLRTKSLMDLSSSLRMLPLRTPPQHTIITILHITTITH